MTSHILPSALDQFLRIIEQHAPNYVIGLLIGFAILIPASIAFVLTGREQAVSLDLSRWHHRIGYVIGGAMYAGLIYTIMKAMNLSGYYMFASILVLPFWPKSVRNPAQMVSIVVSLISRLRLEESATQETKAPKVNLAARTTSSKSDSQSGRSRKSEARSKGSSS